MTRNRELVQVLTQVESSRQHFGFSRRETALVQLSSRYFRGRLYSHSVSIRRFINCRVEYQLIMRIIMTVTPLVFIFVNVMYQVAAQMPDTISTKKQMLPSFKPCCLHKRSLEVSVYNTHTFAHFNPGFHDELTEHNHGNIVTEHAIRIRHTGQYYIYVNVHFCSNVTNEILAVHIYGSNLENPPEVKLLIFSEFRNPNRGPYEKSFFLGDSFHLKAGDQVQVCLSDKKLVKFSKESTYLGVYLIHK